MRQSAFVNVFLLGFMYGTTMIASRYTVGIISSIGYVGLRMLIAALGFTLVFVNGWFGQSFPRDRTLWKHGTMLGVFGTVAPMILIVTSLKYQSSGVTSTLLTSNPALTVVMAHFLLSDEQLTWRKLLGVGLAFSGALLIILLGETGLPEWEVQSRIGYVMVGVAMLLGSGMAIYIRRYMSDCDPFQVAGVRIYVSAMILFVPVLILSGQDLPQMTPLTWGALGYAALAGTFIATLLDFYNIQRFGATVSAMVSYVVPVIAGISGALLLNEQITSGMVAGMVLILSGVSLVNRGVVLERTT